MPLCDHLRAHEHRRRLGGEALQRGVERTAPLDGVGVEPQHRDAREQLAHGLAHASGARTQARELHRAADRALARRTLREAAVMAAQPPARVQREADVAALAAEALAAAPAVQRGRLTAPVEEEDRTAALVRQSHEPRAQRARERIEPVVAQVDDLDPRQVAPHACRQRCARQAMPALRAGRGRSEHEHGTLETRSLGGDAAGVVARIVALLVRGLVLLVHDDQADARQGREDRRARTHDDAHEARADGLVDRPALAVGEPGVQHGDLVAEARGEAACGLRRERDLRHQHEHAAVAPERALGGAEVHLGLARPCHPVEQEVATARLDQRLDAGDRRGLGIRQRLRGRRSAGDHVRYPEARLESDQAVLRQPANRGGRGACPLDQLGEGQRAVREQLEQRATPRRPGRGAGGGDPRVAGRAHARRKCQRQRTRRRRAVVGRDPEAQLEHDGSHARLVRESLHARQLALVPRRSARLDDDAAHAAPRQRHVDDIAARKLGALGRQVVEGLAQRPRRHKRNDSDNERRRHREIIAHGVVAARARMQRDRAGRAQACAAPAPSARASVSARSVRSQVKPSWSRPKWP